MQLNLAIYSPPAIYSTDTLFGSWRLIQPRAKKENNVLNWCVQVTTALLTASRKPTMRKPCNRTAIDRFPQPNRSQRGEGGGGGGEGKKVNSSQTGDFKTSTYGATIGEQTANESARVRGQESRRKERRRATRRRSRVGDAEWRSGQAGVPPLRV